MKYFILLLFLAFYLPASPQTVSIPDTSFARCLKTAYKSIFGADGKMSIAGANAVTGTLDCTTGNIRNAEGLQYFVNITSLHLESNQLDTLPNLSTLSKLNYLNVSYNNLEYLPGLDKLTLLENLNCYRNKLKELPSLANLNQLSTFQAHSNQLTKVPVLGTKPKLVYVYLNDNRIASLSTSDFTACPKLTNVRLYQNPLTFRELVKLKAKSGYDTLFKLVPPSGATQHYFGQPSFREIKEADTVVFSTGIDKGLSGVSYEWYKNGVQVAITDRDSLLLTKTSFSDSGTYSCVLRHVDFSAVKLLTVPYRLEIKPCMDLNQIRLAVTEINCLNEGTAFITTATENIALFELRSLATGKKLSSRQGQFSNLSETMYQLSLTTPTGCTKDYTKPVQLIRKECEEVLISPNDDGQADSYFFEEQGNVTIYDKRGNKIRTMSIPGEWDGRAEKDKVFSGFYVADINNGTRLIGITVLY